MTAREDREWKNKNNFGEKRMNMLCECLHKDPAHRVFTFGPSPVTATPSFISSPSIRRKKKQAGAELGSTLVRFGQVKLSWWLARWLA